MNEWRWIKLDEALAIHDTLLALYGAAYAEPDVTELAASYLVALAATQCFIEGDKRAAWGVAQTFLLLMATTSKQPIRRRSRSQCAPPWVTRTLLSSQHSYGSGCTLKRDRKPVVDIIECRHGAFPQPIEISSR